MREILKRIDISKRTVKNNQNIIIAWFVIDPKIHKLLQQYSIEAKDGYN